MIGAGRQPITMTLPSPSRHHVRCCTVIIVQHGTELDWTVSGSLHALICGDFAKCKQGRFPLAPSFHAVDVSRGGMFHDTPLPTGMPSTILECIPPAQISVHDYDMPR